MAIWLRDAFHLSGTVVATCAVRSAPETQCVFVLLIVIGVDGLRLVEVLLDHQTVRRSLFWVVEEKTDDVEKSDLAVHEWMFECANDCDQWLCLPSLSLRRSKSGKV